MDEQGFFTGKYDQLADRLLEALREVQKTVTMFKDLKKSGAGFTDWRVKPGGKEGAAAAVKNKLQTICEREVEKLRREGNRKEVRCCPLIITR